MGYQQNAEQSGHADIVLLMGQTWGQYSVIPCPAIFKSSTAHTGDNISVYQLCSALQRYHKNVRTWTYRQWRKTKTRLMKGKKSTIISEWESKSRGTWNIWTWKWQREPKSASELWSQHWCETESQKRNSPMASTAAYVVRKNVVRTHADCRQTCNSFYLIFQLWLLMFFKRFVIRFILGTNISKCKRTTFVGYKNCPSLNWIKLSNVMQFDGLHQIFKSTACWSNSD